MGKHIYKNISKNLSTKYSWKLLDHVEQSATDAFKTTSKRIIQKTAEANGDQIGNNITEKIIKVSKTSPQNGLEIVKNEHDKEIPKERYIFPKERQKIIDDLRLILQYNNGISKNNKSAVRYTKSTD